MAVTSLSALRAQRGSFESVKKDIENLNKKSTTQQDDRFWTCKQDATGNGSAIIRFLPAPKGEEFAFVKRSHYSFKAESGLWYWENSLRQIGLDDPCTEYINSLYATKNPVDEELAKKRGLKTKYFSNVLIISDPANPENEGKVFIYEYNKTIFKMLSDKIAPPEPEFDDDEQIDPVNPFDFWDGMNFRLKIKIKDKFANFDSSSFAKPSEIADTDEEIEAIWSQCHPLAEIISPDKFKTYEQLKTRLDLVLGNTKSSKPNAKGSDLSEDDVEFLQATAKEKPKAEVKPKPKPKPVETPTIDPADDPSSGEDTEDDLSYFARLAAE